MGLTTLTSLVFVWYFSYFAPLALTTWRTCVLFSLASVLGLESNLAPERKAQLPKVQHNWEQVGSMQHAARGALCH